MAFGVVQLPCIETEADPPPIWIAFDWQSYRFLSHITCTADKQCNFTTDKHCKKSEISSDIQMFKFSDYSMDEMKGKGWTYSWMHCSHSQVGEGPLLGNVNLM